MELRELFKVARRRWWLIAIPSLVALVVAGYGYLKAPPPGGFAGQMSFTAAVPPDDTESYEDGALAPWTSSEYVVNALADWVRTSSFAEEVSAELTRDNIEIPAGSILASINADNERSVLVIYLSGGDAEALTAIAEASIRVLETKSSDYFPQLSNGVDVITLSEPQIGPVPPPVTDRFEPIIRFAMGVIAGVALAFLVEYLDPTIRERKEVESLGLAVLVEIPSQSRK